MIQKIEQVLNSRVRPQLQKDGGNIEILKYDEDKNILKLRLMGQCCACPHASHTSDNLIQIILKEEIPHIKSISVETGLSEEMLDLAKQFLRG